MSAPAIHPLRFIIVRLAGRDFAVPAARICGMLLRNTATLRPGQPAGQEQGRGDQGNEHGIEVGRADRDLAQFQRIGQQRIQRAQQHHRARRRQQQVVHQQLYQRLLITTNQ